MTDKGSELQKISKKIVTDYNQYIYSHIPDDDMKVFFKVIEKINALTNDINTATALVNK